METVALYLIAACLAAIAGMLAVFLARRPVADQHGDAPALPPPSAPSPAAPPLIPVPLAHTFSAAYRPPEVEIMQREPGEWKSLGFWQDGHPDLEHGEKAGFGIRRHGVIHEGTE